MKSKVNVKSFFYTYSVVEVIGKSMSFTVKLEKRKKLVGCSQFIKNLCVATAFALH